MKIPLKAISLNNLYSTGQNGKRFLTKRGRYFKEAFQNYLLGEFFITPYARFEGEVVVELVFCFKDKRKRDVDNMVKVIFDSCTGILWSDDSQVQAVYAEKRQGDEDFILIEVSEPTPCKTCGHLYVH